MVTRLPPSKKPAPRLKAVPDRSVSTAVGKLLDGLVLDDAGNAKAAIARALASKLDESVGSESGPVAMATAGIARELREVVDAILETTEDDGAFVANLFSQVGDS